MAYDNTSFYGDMIVEEYDEANNFINPQSPVGYYIYHILGDGFDKMSEISSKFLNDFSVLSADSTSLDKYWGVSYNLPRPKLPVSNRELTDEEYRVYLYLLNCRLITVEDIIINFNKCFGIDDYEVYIDYTENYLELVDHNDYTAISDITSNLKRNNEDNSKHFITTFKDDEDTEVIESVISEVEERIIRVNIPFNNWDNEFLVFLEPYISIKGNLKITEYSL
jgi:hypothetical protein